jgi:hypothetical protein
MTRCNDMASRTLLLGVVLSLLALQACVSEGSAQAARYAHLFEKPIQDPYLKSALESFRLQPLKLRQSGPRKMTLRVIDASSWGRAVLEVKVDTSSPNHVHGEVTVESWEPNSRGKTRSQKSLTTAQMRIVSECVQQMRKARVFIDARRVPMLESATVDDTMVLIELMDDQGYATGLWPGNSPNWKILSIYLTKFYQLTDENSVVRER